MDVSATRIGIAVVEHDGHYLVGVRGEAGPLPGCAEFPGGKCRTDEPPEACAIRECFEETGLPVTAERQLETRRHDYPHGTVELHFWLCRPVDPDTVCNEHHDFRWVPAEELAALEFPEANESVVRLLGRRYGG